MGSPSTLHGMEVQAHPQATAPHPVLVPRVHVADDLHQVLGVNAADPLLGQAEDSTGVISLWPGGPTLGVQDMFGAAVRTSLQVCARAPP